ncbi:hypothetical protein J5N97_025440 [Dioscorea zingiberensis]|uniref:Cytochrome P450 n=1 Tax=Dioscorea zingiberensis TaxID=325984 RepID=A0A9D5HA08_9LILI|nr:hypothetical protein J5N97_025440 [Dioscorea zingiberensis]
MAEMIGKPETIRKAQEELDSLVGKEEMVDDSHLPKLPYLEALVKETLRLHPPIPFLLPRYSTTTCNIGGYTIPKGTKVFINVWSIHRDPVVWENPLEFKPERFLAGVSKCDYYGNNFNFIPFGSGRRICVGIPLVEKMSLYILATMLHCFDWSLPDEPVPSQSSPPNTPWPAQQQTLHPFGHIVEHLAGIHWVATMAQQLVGHFNIKTAPIRNVAAEDMVVGGTENTSNTVEWAMAELMQKPKMMRRIQEELEQVVGKENVVEESHIPKLTYLGAVIKEVLRLHPALPLLVPHSPSSSCTINGYNVPQGSQVFVNVWAIHRDPCIWEDPLEFIPERFLNMDDSSRWDFSGNDFRYFPFGSGRRICAGIPMAERIVGYALASLLHSFDWNLPEGTKLDLSERFGIVLKKAEPLVALPTPKLPNLLLDS